MLFGHCGYLEGTDPVMIEKDGGKWLRLSDGRILEYFLYGSTNEDAKVFTQTWDCGDGSELHSGASMPR